MEAMDASGTHDTRPLSQSTEPVEEEFLASVLLQVDPGV
jgi:hypothetical protein